MSAPHSIHHRTEPLADGTNFILPRRPNGTSGGLCLIFFGLIFSGFALFWIAGATGLLDGVIDKLFDDAMQIPDDGPGDDNEDAEPTPKVKDKTPGPEPIEPELEPRKAAEPIEPVEPATAKPPRTKDHVTPPKDMASQATPESLKEWYEKKVEQENKKRGSGYGGSAGGFDIGRLFFGLFGLPFFLVGLVPIAAGLMSIFGHTEVTVTADELVATDRVGFIRKRKSCALASIERFDVGRDVNAVSTSSSSSQVHQRYTFAIHAHGTQRLLSIASGYPMLMLLPLAQDLAREVQRRVGGQLMEVRDTSHLEPHDEAAGGYVPETVPPQPQGSTAVLERVASGITLKIPPMGFRKSNAGLLGFALFWLGFVSLFTLGMFASGVPLGMYLFISIFWIVGILVLLLALNMARKQAVFDVVHDTLLLTQQGIFGRSMHEWRVDDLIDIRADFSGTSVNKRPLLNIQIIPRDGKNVSLLTGRTDEELQWIAAELRRAMGMRKRD